MPNKENCYLAFDVDVVSLRPQGRRKRGRPQGANSSHRYPMLKSAIDKFWAVHHYPPTIRDLVGMTDITSTSVVSYFLRRLPEIRIDRGRIIPLWVDDIFTVNSVSSLDTPVSRPDAPGAT